MELYVVGFSGVLVGAVIAVVLNIGSHFTGFLVEAKRRQHDARIDAHFPKRVILRGCDHCNTKEMMFDEFTTVGDNPILLLCGHCKAIWGPRNAYQKNHPKS